MTKQADPNTTLVLTGPLDTPRAQDHHITRTLIVGRSKSCDIAIDDLKLSRRQARLFRDMEGRLLIEDLGSKNGTLVNGMPVSIQVLANEDSIELGASRFTINLRETRPARLDPNAGSLIKDVSSTALPNLRQFTEDHAALLSRHHTTNLPAQRFSDLFTFSQMLQAATDPEEMLLTFLEKLIHCHNSDFASLFMLGSDGELFQRAAVSLDDEIPHLKLNQTVIEHVLTHKRAVITPDLQNDNRFVNSDSIQHGQIRSCLAVPVIIGQDAHGILAVYQNSYALQSELDLDFLFIVASILGPCLQNLDLAQQRQQDLAKLKATNNQLISVQKKLKRSEKLALVGHLSGGLLHEVNNLLSPLSLINVIIEDNMDNEDLQDLNSIITQIQTRSASLINEFRFFSSGQRPEHHVSRCDLNVLITKVIHFVRYDPRLKGLAITLEPSPAEPLVEIDEDQISQVLINLVRNAADAMKDRARGLITIATTIDGDRVLLSVADNGAGIPVEIQSRIFEPLFSTKGELGLGLGLDICKRIVQDHDGVLTFSTQLDEGTTFTLNLPLAN